MFTTNITRKGETTNNNNKKISDTSHDKKITKKTKDHVITSSSESEKKRISSEDSKQNISSNGQSNLESAQGKAPVTLPIITPSFNNSYSITNIGQQSNNYQSLNKLPTFKPSPSAGSVCHPDADNTTRESLNSICQEVNSLHHSVDVDDKLMHLSEDNNRAGAVDVDAEGCKMLWFAAMHESESLCDESSNHHSYNVDYSVALNSALENAHDSLQPVLILGRYGMTNKNSTKSKKLGRWAEAKGAKVVYSPRLTFQEDIDKVWKKSISYAHLQGPFLRLDIPKYIKEHRLLDLPNVCKSHVLYTDVDVVFANRITQRDVKLLSKSVGQGIISYGREFFKKARILNTGVMVTHVERFGQEIPKIIRHARRKKISLKNIQDSRSKMIYPRNDQEMLNLYRVAKYQSKEKFKLLPIWYNWKAYWSLEPSDFSQVKIIHFHDPKLGTGL